MPWRPSNEPTYVAVMQRHAGTQPEKTACRFLQDGEDDAVALTYAELDRRARVVASRLLERTAPGERALLLYPPGLDFLAGFLGCLYAGVVAVPAYPPDPLRLERTLPRLLAIVSDSGAAVVLTTDAIQQLASGFAALAPGISALAWLATDTLGAGGDDRHLPAIGPETVAFLQYTSGSTGQPKGVVLTHACLMANERQIGSAFAHDASNDVVSWLPVYHDMGLIGNLLHPLWLGSTTTFMSPFDFLKRPVRWLKAITRYRPATSGGPNFGYDLCVRKVKPAEIEALDLSSWRMAYNGSERVRAETMENFASTFAACGFSRVALQPVYGLAEATLMVSGRFQAKAVVEDVPRESLEIGRCAAPAVGGRRAATTRVVSCGPPCAEERVLIVDPETCAPRAPGEVGEIWIHGPNVARGYWQNLELTEQVFGARLAGANEGPFLRTGDLGYLRGGLLFVTGRFKDLIIVRGRNIYPEDVELAVEKCDPALRPGCVAAFAVERGDAERLVVVAEVERRWLEGGRPSADEPQRRAGTGPSPVPPGDTAALEAAVREVITETFEVQAADVVLIAPGTMPKTSSGKVQRHTCKSGYLATALETV